MQISEVINHLNYTLDSIKRDGGPSSNDLHQAIKNIKSATDHLDPAKLHHFEQACATHISDLQARIKHMDEADPSHSIQNVSEIIVDLSKEIFPFLNKPSSIQELDLASSIATIANRYDTNDHSLLQVFAAWISENEIPLADLNWRAEDLLKIAPYLTTVNLTDFQMEMVKRDMGISDEDFIKSFKAAKKMILLGNNLSSGFNRGIESLNDLEELRVLRCRCEKGLPDFSKNPKLSHILLRELNIEEGSLDFSNCRSLKSLEIVALPEFNQPLLLPTSGKLETIKLDYLTKFNSILDFQNSQGLKNLRLNLLRSFNEVIDLSQCARLEGLAITRCDQWDKGIILPLESKLKSIDLTDCRKLPGDLTPLGGYLDLEIIDLTNCRRLSSEIDYSKLVQLTHLSLQNCLSYTGGINIADPTKLQLVNLKGVRDAEFSKPKLA